MANQTTTGAIAAAGERVHEHTKHAHASHLHAAHTAKVALAPADTPEPSRGQGA